jgi:hypothetical protein
MGEKLRRVYRPATPEERARHAIIREQVKKEFPPLHRRQSSTKNGVSAKKDEGVMTLTTSDVVAVLDRFLAGELTEAQVVEWADRHEYQEYVEDAAVASALFELATPEINGSLTHERVREIRSKLG